MKEIVCVKLENDMDLILAHKRVMKLCELTGFSLISQTSIATAVSEIARCAIEYGRGSELVLGVELAGTKRFLRAVIRDKADFTIRCTEATQYAKRLVDSLEIQKTGKETSIVLKQSLNFSGTLTESKIESIIDYFRKEPPVSAYDEIRRKNLLLHDLAEKIQESENDYRVLTDTLPLMMFSVNNRGTITYSNKWLQDYFEFTPRTLDGTSWQSLLHQNDFNSFFKDLSNALSRQIAFNGQYRFKERISGNYFWHLLSLSPLKNEKEAVIRWIGFIVDINAQKQVEQTLKYNQELKQMQDQLFFNQNELQKKVLELNRSNYELEQFAHLASHDLQEPLRKLFFYTDVLKNRYTNVLDEAGVGILTNMSSAASRMKELINDLLNYSQLQKPDLQFEEVNLNALFQEIIRDLDITIKEKRAVIDSDELPILEGNPLRLRQLFMNIISNALKYSKKDQAVKIEIRSTLTDAGATISIRDNGIGFDEEYKEKIFGLFERLHTRDKYPGTGIGLSICKRIAELHHGTISASSVLGEYSIFEVLLPTIQKPVTVDL
jgi:PAS domain S-box-containing protein